jgi:flagellar hook protein FlgE
MNAIYTGVSGMQAYQTAVDVIANNVANVNTVAYRSGRVTFDEMMGRTLFAGTSEGLNPQQIGAGVTIGSVDLDMTPGTMQPTGRSLDLAIAGDSYFIATDGRNKYYTRDGVMQLDDQNRLLMSNSGLSVAGWLALKSAFHDLQRRSHDKFRFGDQLDGLNAQPRSNLLEQKTSGRYLDVGHFRDDRVHHLHSG